MPVPAAASPRSPATPAFPTALHLPLGSYCSVRDSRSHHSSLSFFRIRNVTLNHSFHYLSLDLQNANSFRILCQFSEALDHQLTLPRALITASCYLVGRENGVSISSSPPDVTTTPTHKTAMSGTFRSTFPQSTAGTLTAWSRQEPGHLFHCLSGWSKASDQSNPPAR